MSDAVKANQPHIIFQAYEQHNNNGDSEKNWEFPKRHTHAHMFDDIVAKGVTKNYSTKPSEQMHGEAKKVYARVTNFKEVEGQVIIIIIIGLISAQCFKLFFTLDPAAQSLDSCCRLYTCSA